GATRCPADRSAERRTVGDVEGHEVRAHYDSDRADAETADREGLCGQACREDVAVHDRAGGAGDSVRRRRPATPCVLALVSKCSVSPGCASTGNWSRLAG